MKSPSTNFSKAQRGRQSVTIGTQAGGEVGRTVGGEPEAFMQEITGTLRPNFKRSTREWGIFIFQRA
jgi:hypothetical protein